MNTYRAGIDIGSTTVKLVLLDEEGKLLFGEYRRHCAHTQEALSALLREARERVGDCALRAKITGSGAINLAKALGIPFVQEVVAVADARLRRPTWPSSSAARTRRSSTLVRRLRSA